MKRLFFFAAFVIHSAVLAHNAFKVIPLGVKGGLDESNLSAYLVAPTESDSYICLDAGTLTAGLEKAITHSLFSEDAANVLKKHVKGYVISHAHLDHVSGLILNSVDDANKNIYGTQSTIDSFERNYFNWQSWPNFGSNGNPPQLKKYKYQILTPGQSSELENTSMTVTAYPLSHSAPFQSTAFLVKSKSDYILYLGDTGPDEIEKSDHLSSLWKIIAPLIRKKQLKALFIEVSFPNEQADKLLFGHLTPHWLFKEMEVLSRLTGKDALRGLNLIVTHMKPSGDNEKTIMSQLAAQNIYEINFVFPQQASLYRF